MNFFVCLRRFLELNNNILKLIFKLAFMEWDEDEDEDVKKRFSGLLEFFSFRKIY